MSVHVIAILVLVAAFVVATVLPINLGALSLVAALIIGSIVLSGSPDDVADGIFEGFPGSLFVILVGVTFLFAIARANGTVDWLVHQAVRGVGGRIALIPWIMFVVTGATWYRRVSRNLRSTSNSRANPKPPWVSRQTFAACHEASAASSLAMFASAPQASPASNRRAAS